MDDRNDIQKLKDGIEKAKNLRQRAIAQKEILQKQQEELKTQIKEMGFDPDNLDDEIKKLKEKADYLIKKANEEMPWDLLEKVK